MSRENGDLVGLGLLALAFSQQKEKREEVTAVPTVPQLPQQQVLKPSTLLLTVPVNKATRISDTPKYAKMIVILNDSGRDVFIGDENHQIIPVQNNSIVTFIAPSNTVFDLSSLYVLCYGDAIEASQQVSIKLKVLYFV